MQRANRRPFVNPAENNRYTACSDGVVKIEPMCTEYTDGPVFENAFCTGKGDDYIISASKAEHASHKENVYNGKEVM